MSTRDNQVVGVMSRCESNGSLGLCKSWTLDWTRGLDYGLSFGLNRLMLPDVTVCKWLKLLFKVPWALAKAF